MFLSTSTSFVFSYVRFVFLSTSTSFVSLHLLSFFLYVCLVCFPTPTLFLCIYSYFLFFFTFLIDWLMIAYIALFSALLSRLTALACGFTWVASFIARFLNIHRSGVLTELAWLVPHEIAAVWAQVLCTPYNHAPSHFMQNHIRKVDSCLAVTCHLHFWQNAGIFYVLLR